MSFYKIGAGPRANMLLVLRTRVSRTRDLPGSMQEEDREQSKHGGELTCPDISLERENAYVRKEGGVFVFPPVGKTTFPWR